MRTDFRAVRSELKSGDEALGSEIGAPQRLMSQLFGGLCVSMIFGFAGIVVAMLTHHV
ncbi:MAG TPA: hypothetical protein VMF55_09825 [Solirubrobacterales bacterium]|nr:hypothetical protein [Solirubrobacterales bacterium]